MFVVEYVRVSSSEQRYNGTGFARQDDTIQLFCKGRGWEPQFAIFEDVSGAKDCAYRIGLLIALEYLAGLGDEQTIIVVENSSRWARDLIVGEVLLNKCRELGVQVWSASEGIELTTQDNENPSATAIRQILAVLAQLDKANIVSRLKMARTIKRRGDTVAKSGIGPGGVEGQKPYGLLEGELQVLILMLDMESSGATTVEIAAELNYQKIKTRKGRKWSKASVWKILRNQRSLALVPPYMRA